MTRRFVVQADAAAVATTAAARLAVRLVDLLTVQDTAHVALTGGGVGTAVLRDLATQPAADAVDWTRVHLWWGDERFLADGDPDRNETQARGAWLDGLVASGALPAANVHAMPASDGLVGDDPAAAAGVYAEQLRVAVPAGGHLPVLDVVLLGVGPDGHVASLFPAHPGVDDVSAWCIPVHDSPKPPPTRLSLTLPVLNGARAVWLLAAGAEKAGAVGDAVQLAGGQPLPAGRVSGVEETLWLLDVAAAGRIPVGTGRAPAASI